MCRLFIENPIEIIYVLFQHFWLYRMQTFISTVQDHSIRNVLSKLFSLYGIWSLEKHMQYLYQGGYAVGPQPATIVQDSILQLCSEVKDDAIALIDVIAPPDFLLKSALGASDGQVNIPICDCHFYSESGVAKFTFP